MYIYQFFTGAASETVGISLGKTEEVSKMIFLKVIFHGGKFNFFSFSSRMSKIEKFQNVTAGLFAYRGP